MRSAYTLVFFFSIALANAQTATLRLHPGLVLSKDSIESKSIISALGNFLASCQKSNDENKWVYEPERLETSVQLDEISGIEKSIRYKNDTFFKPYLNNIVLLKDHRYLLQVSYIGTTEMESTLRASFEFIAHKSDSSVTFSSTLVSNTRDWKTSIIGNNTFHYQKQIDSTKIKELSTLSSLLDAKLQLTNQRTDYYCTENIFELQNLIGITFKSDYNGRMQAIWSSALGKKQVIVLGNNNAAFTHFDPHDLFHDRLSLVTQRSSVNRPVDEGCAYLYGGSWGFSWKDIFKAFKEQIASNKNTNWTELKETPVLFKTGNFSNAADYIVNALLIKKIENEKGFSGVWQLLNVGPFEKGNEKYYQALEKLTGITKANYNEKIWELIETEK